MCLYFTNCDEFRVKVDRRSLINRRALKKLTNSCARVTLRHAWRRFAGFRRRFSSVEDERVSAEPEK